MLPIPKNTVQRLILAVGLFIAVAAAAYYFGGSLMRQSPGTSLDREVVKNNKIKITANTDLVQKITYAKCGDVEVYSNKPSENLVGIDIDQLQKIYAGWIIDRFDSQVVEMSLKVDSYCREHANNMFLGIKDGYVAVYYGKPGIKAIVKEITDIHVSRLSKEDAAEIRQGLVVQSREDLLRTLEGLSSR